MAEPFNFHLMAKPSGPICNLDCSYCFYLEKEGFIAQSNRFRMTDDVLETYIRQYIESQDVPEIHFAWQGGEPTLMGVEFFRKAVELQKKYAHGRKIHNGFQTNGTLLNEEWGDFLAENGFLVGISIDGPEKLHDAFRVDKGGRPTFQKVMAGLDVLKRHGVEFNTLTVVNARNSREPRNVYRFLKEIGSTFHQYIPLIERLPNERARELGLDFAPPPESGEVNGPPVAPWSVPSKQWGVFLAAIFDEWITNDVGTIFVNHFENTIAAVAGFQPGMCVYRETCGKALVIEHSGHVYSCDHFVYPEYELGNIMTGDLRQMVESPAQEKFGNDKATTLPSYCWKCEYVSACHGECPKHRFINTPDGEPGLNYLCAGLKHYFAHCWPRMERIVNLLQRGEDPGQIMNQLRQKGKPKRR